MTTVRETDDCVAFLGSYAQGRNVTCANPDAAPKPVLLLTTRVLPVEICGGKSLPLRSSRPGLYWSMRQRLRLCSAVPNGGHATSEAPCKWRRAMLQPFRVHADARSHAVDSRRTTSRTVAPKHAKQQSRQPWFLHLRGGKL